MTDRPVTLSSGLPETVLDAEPEDFVRQLDAAMALADPSERRTAVAALVAANPRSLEAWSRLGAIGRDVMERYSAYRVGYHRGLDRLRAEGWRGSGYVRWRHPSNRAFLRNLDGLRSAAAEIGEADEIERIGLFLLQLDPDWERRIDRD